MKQIQFEVHCKEALADALVFAIKHGCVAALVGKLEYLGSYYEGGKAVITGDSAPWSFGFHLEDASGQRELVGGLIYSGPCQQLDGRAPTFTTSVESGNNDHRWTTHT